MSHFAILGQRGCRSTAPDGPPAHSFRSLLAGLATLARNTVTTDITRNYPITVLTRPTANQHKAFALPAVTYSQ